MHVGGGTVPFLRRAKPAHIPSPASRVIHGQRTNDDRTGEARFGGPTRKALSRASFWSSVLRVAGALSLHGRCWR